MYHRPYYLFFDTIHHPCDGMTTMVTSMHLENKKVSILEHIHPTSDGLLNQMSSDSSSTTTTLFNSVLPTSCNILSFSRNSTQI